MSESTEYVQISLADVQLLWDTVVASMDWGSGFLDAEEMWRIIAIGHRFGFNISETLDGMYRVDGDYLAWERSHPTPTRWLPGFTWSADPAVRATHENPNFAAEWDEWKRSRDAFFAEKLAKVLAAYDG